MSCSSLLMWIATIAGVFTIPLFSNVASLLPDEMAVPETQTETVIIENVDTVGGVEVFPLPDRSSGRIFAAAMGFQPHVAGQFEDWLYIYYFDRGTLQSGWTPLNQIILTEEELASLPTIAPDNLPPLPNLTANTLASRPYGVQVADTPVVSVTDTPAPPPPPGQPPPTSVPTAVPTPIGTEEVTG
ncbi:MAG: hypothetical protein L0154_18540 [Chloroflexi bacterium]|nr:hypothetical protein [Chloroflexota bacterium]